MKKKKHPAHDLMTFEQMLDTFMTSSYDSGIVPVSVPEELKNEVRRAFTGGFISVIGQLNLMIDRDIPAAKMGKHIRKLSEDSLEYAKRYGSHGQD